MLTRRLLLAAPLIATASRVAAASPTPDWARRLVRAAEAQIGVTTLYDPAYVRLAYPMGDVPPDRGVCSDVVVRAYRDGLGLDLQRLVHEDMRARFEAYPRRWALTAPDRNIDHRRVLNLEVFLTRRGARLPASAHAPDYLPGDLVGMTLPGNLPHIAIVSATLTVDEARPLLVHNIGSGTRREDVLFRHPLTGRYRWGG